MRCEQLRSNFYTLNLHSGKINLNSSHNFHFFFIVEHTSDEEFIKKEALQLLLRPGCYYDFYGSYSQQWKTIFDKVDVMIRPYRSDKEAVLTSTWNNINDFVDVLHSELSCRPLIPCDNYLIYDNKELYQIVLDKLNILKTKGD